MTPPQIAQRPEKRCCNTPALCPSPSICPAKRLSHLGEAPISTKKRGCAKTIVKSSVSKDDKHKHDRSIMAPVSADSAGDLAHEVLQALANTDQILSTEAFPNVPFETLKAALDRLSSRSMVVYEQIERQEAILEPEAEQIVEHGSHEARVFEAVHKALGGLSIQDLETTIGDKNVTKVGQGKAFREKWIKKEDNKLVALVSLGLR